MSGSNKQSLVPSVHSQLVALVVVHCPEAKKLKAIPIKKVKKFFIVWFFWFLNIAISMMNKEY